MYGARGVLESSPDGLKVQCHVCGQWVNGLGQHGWMAHALRANEYREQFGLMAKTGLASPSLKQRRAELMTVSAHKCNHEERKRNLLAARYRRLGHPEPYRPRRDEAKRVMSQLTRTDEAWRMMSQKGVAARASGVRLRARLDSSPPCEWCHDPLVGAKRRYANRFCSRPCYIRALQGKDTENLQRGRAAMQHKRKPQGVHLT